MTESGSCCRCCTSLILSSGFAALFLWLSLRTHKPKCSIEFFYIPALNQSANSQSNSSVFFDLRLKNENKDKSVYYDLLNLTLFHEPDRSHPIGNMTISGFHQGRDKKAFRSGNFTSGLDWKAVSRNGSAVFRLNLVTAVRYKIIFWKTKRENLRVGANVEVNGQGSKAYPKGITLKSGAAVVGDCCLLVRVLLGVFVLILFSFL